MHDWKSLSHVWWDCKYHVVIVPNYRKKVINGKFRHQLGPVLRWLCQQRIRVHLSRDNRTTARRQNIPVKSFKKDD